MLPAAQVSAEETPKPLIDVKAITEEVRTSTLVEHKAKIQRKIVQFVQTIRTNEATLATANANLLKFQEEVHNCKTEQQLKDLITKYAI